MMVKNKLLNFLKIACFQRKNYLVRQFIEMQERILVIHHLRQSNVVCKPILTDAMENQAMASIISLAQDSENKFTLQEVME